MHPKRVELISKLRTDTQKIDKQVWGNSLYCVIRGGATPPLPLFHLCVYISGDVSGNFQACGSVLNQSKMPLISQGSLMFGHDCINLTAVFLIFVLGISWILYYHSINSLGIASVSP